MKKLLILSGKGGTGKTTTASAFIDFANAKAFADCDVDAPNLHIVTKMNSEPEEEDYYGSSKAYIDTKKCVKCGKCLTQCKFEAINTNGNIYWVDEFACEGCGVCEYVCPKQAVELKKDKAGRLKLYKDDKVFSTAQLKMGRGNSGKLVSEVKSKMIKSAKDAEIAIIDGSPGIGCPVIASVSGMNLVLIVTEPTLSGFSDLERIIKTATALHTDVAVCINKFDICTEKTDMIKKYCEDKKIPFVGCIPYDNHALKAVNAGKSIAQIDCIARNALKNVYENTIKLLNN